MAMPMEQTEAIRVAVAEAVKALKQGKDVGDPNVARFVNGVKGSPAEAPTAGMDAHLKKPGMKLARWARAFAAGGCKAEGAIEVLKQFGNHDMAEYAKKALETQTPTGGQYVVPIEFATDIIPVLHELTFVYELGATQYPMSRPIVNVPRLDVQTAASYFGETEKTPTSQPRFGMVELKEKKLGALVPISNDLLESSDPAADEIVKNDLSISIALKRDEKALLGEGNANIPLGVLNSGINKVTCGRLLTADDPVMFVQSVLQKRKRIIKGGWVFPSIVWLQFMNMKTTTGAYIYREEMTRNGIIDGTLLGYKYAISDLIPVGSDGHGLTTMAFGDWTEFLVGERNQMQMAMSMEASFVDSSGATHNAFQEDLTLLRAIEKHDFAVRHKESFCFANDVWTK